MSSRRSRTPKNGRHAATASRPDEPTLADLLVAGEKPNPAQDALLRDRGEAIYKARQAELERKHHGKVAAIEIESRRVYLAADIGGAAMKALAAHPGRVFYFRVIGPVTRSRLTGSMR